ncbi:hypothetical protein P170DRAFT_344901 [Aspergillus steynii IBT 23096]|uniref:Protein prenylyltransferase n=1 Tax=Aspergillus steynii IBT 23096 TaxID=1392250 RepID=A0A2I2GNA7_9EURO|nr:uncharacterized protein P170DRAFT_344901 [Aspergillus steynii IBT 23096]PLB54353.1 hypothetical protein P170DRAFT_344901 [Aspergillus steynii IBT 23096]
MSSPDSAFQNLARIFATRNNRILEIEILPPVLGPLLQDDCSIGITKKYLVQAFVTARRIFFKDPICRSDRDSSTASKDGDAGTTAINPEEKFEDFSICSEVILLFDCEHLTACNWRKKRLASLIQRHELDHDNSGAWETLLQALHAEVSLMTSFLCSPLHRHTKSPTLWQHRLWVLDKMLRLRDIDRGTLRNLLEEELAIVLRAGELHPKNYYAFSYMRQLHGILAEYMQGSSSSLRLLAEPIIKTTLNWCQSHPADISGWMFALYVLEMVEDRGVRENAISRVSRFALDIGWEGESLWTFVTLAAKAFNLTEPTRKVTPMDEFP